MKMEWEHILINQELDGHGILMSTEITERSKVHEGWLVKHTYISTTANSNHRTETMAFVPDKYHKWKLDK